MMKYCIPFLFFLGLSYSSFAQPTPYERSNKKETATYAEAIAYYEALDQAYSQAKLISYGTTDFGKPLHVLVLSKEEDFDPTSLKRKDKRVILINNGIHPGEPEGIDASMMFARDLLKGNGLPKDVVICIIPVYNIGGSMNRSGTSRADQNGPVEYGFRGNSKNYDLNRDFIKTDSKNSAALQTVFSTWQPEVFVDNHTSNGSDYQHIMTLIPTQKDKLNPILSAYLTAEFVPYLYKEMEKAGFPMVPYMNTIGQTPDTGIKGFMETPRYSSGYAALHNVIGFIPETHMLKEYSLRVEATYALMEKMISFVQRNAVRIGINKKKADAAVATQTTFPVSWALDETEVDSIPFSGYAAGQKASEISGHDRLYYDRNKPYVTMIKELNTYVPTVEVDKPVAYVIPKAWDRVVELLKLNNVVVHELKEDTTLSVESYYIKDFKTTSSPYEGHYLHSEVKVELVQQELPYYKGDYMVYVNQPTNRYIVETLEPQATDSYFNWNFFDSVLGQKEHFSPYIFEDTAVDILHNNPALKEQLEKKKAEDPAFEKNGYAQLEFVYKHSDYYEKTHNRYPVARVLNHIK